MSINLATERLMLRSPKFNDAERIAVLAGEYDVARMSKTYAASLQSNCVARGNEVEARQYVMKTATAKQQSWFRKDNEQRISR